jgi:hypothetical protein
MVSFAALLLPIALSAALVFIASSVIHMALSYHWTDWRRLPEEEPIRSALRGTPPGNYSIPHCATMGEFKREETLKKWAEGPVGFITLLPSGPPKMGKQLGLWFAYSVVVGLCVAYLTSRTLPRGAEYLDVFRVAGTTAFFVYAGAEPVQSIWKGIGWTATLKAVFDGLIYALLTAGVFAWLWPGV